MKTSIQNTHQLLQYGSVELLVQGPGPWSGGELRQNATGEVTDPNLHLGVLQEGEDVFQQAFIQQVRLQLLHLCYVVLHKGRQVIAVMTATIMLGVTWQRGVRCRRDTGTALWEWLQKENTNNFILVYILMQL